MISIKNRFIYIHINCCGGTSVENALADYGERAPKIDPGISPVSPSTQHLTAWETHQVFGGETWDKFFTFTFVRNPWDRMVSYYITHPIINSKMSFKEFLRTEDHSDHKRMYSPCFDWVTDEKGDLMKFDFIGKKEDLQAGFKVVCRKLNIKKDLPFSNTTVGKWPYQYYYDDESKDIVAARFANDIEHFGYEFIDLDRKSYLFKKPLFLTAQAKRKLGRAIKRIAPKLYFLMQNIKNHITGIFERKK